MTRHRPMIRISPNGNTAVLFLHGIVGTPDHFEKFLPLVPDTYSIYNLLLDGHGGTVEAFAKTSMRKWKLQVQKALDFLRKEHDFIIIVGHSMGTLLALDAIHENSDKIKELFFLATPLRVFPKPAATKTSLNVLFDRISLDDPRGMGAKNAYGIIPDKNLLKYLSWIPRYIELIQEAFITRKKVLNIQVPCRVFQSKNDELVLYSSINFLKKNPRIQIYTLYDSGHYWLSEKDEQLVLNEFKKCFSE